MRTQTISSIILWTLLLLLLMMLVGCTGEVEPEPSNRIVVVIDGSGSYKARQQEAVERAAGLLDSLAQKKLHRWEPGQDLITVISLDAIPEVLWEGSVRALKEMDAAAWQAHFAARTDYAGCTDVTAAFDLASGHLDGDPRYVHKYLFVFSDLLHEPPTTAIRRCARPSSLPGEDFPWAALHDVSVSVFWMPPNQKLAWRRAASENGLGSNVALYTTSESGEVVIAPPPPPVVERTEAELQAEKEKVIRLGKQILGGTGLLLLLFVVLVVIMVLLLARRNRNRGAARPTVGGGTTPPAARTPRPGAGRPGWASGQPRPPAARRPAPPRT